MILETLSDFFLFLSTDKKTITSKNLSDFDNVITKKNIVESNNSTNNNSTNSTSTPGQLTKSCQLLINDFLYFLYTKKIINLNAKVENQITAKTMEILKEKYPTDTNSYQDQHKKNAQKVRIKEKETKTILMSMLKDNELNFSIGPEEFLSFFSGSKHKQTVTKFMSRLKLVLNERSKALSIDGNVTDEDGDKSRSDDKSNQNNKSGLSYVSEKDVLVQDKERFLDVLNKVKRNLNKENEEELNKSSVLSRRKTKESKPTDVGQIEIKIEEKGSEVNKEVNKEKNKEENKEKETKQPKEKEKEKEKKKEISNKAAPEKKSKRKKDKKEGKCNCTIY